MKNEVLYDNFIEEVRNRVPENEKISNVLADILMIEKEAVYRRLRKEVPFTFSEIASICTKMKISLDHIIEVQPCHTRPAQLVLTEFIDPDELNYRQMEGVIDLFDMADIYKNPKIGMYCNILPQTVFLNYDYISRFFYFKWKYLFSSAKDVLPLSKLNFSERLRDLQSEHHNGYRRLKEFTMIWDSHIMEYLVNDIRYFSTIRLVTKDDIQALREELLSLLDEMEDVAVKGRFDSGTKVNFYISNINFDNSCIFAENDHYQLGLIKIFNLNGVSTVDKFAYDRIKENVLAIKRVSTLISESGEQQRIIFFDKQRTLIENL